MLRLVAEQARELVGAECCVVTLTLDGLPRALKRPPIRRATARTALIRWLDCPRVLRLLA